MSRRKSFGENNDMKTKNDREDSAVKTNLEGCYRGAAWG
jgi:hypothetical protein